MTLEKSSRDRLMGSHRRDGALGLSEVDGAGHDLKIQPLFVHDAFAKISDFGTEEKNFYQDREDPCSEEPLPGLFSPRSSISYPPDAISQAIYNSWVDGDGPLLH